MSYIPDFFTGLVILMSFFFAPLVTTFLIKVYSSSSLNLSSAMFFWKEYARNHYDRIYFAIFDEIITPILILKIWYKNKKERGTALSIAEFSPYQVISDGINIFTWIFAQPSNTFGNCKRNWPCWYLGQHTNINLEKKFTFVA